MSMLRKHHNLVITVIMLLVTLLLANIPAEATTVYEGEVTRISDGDTIRLKWKGGELKVRLAEIDTPEKRQPYGQAAKQALSDMIWGNPVKVIAVDTDRYGRIIGRLYVHGEYINLKMVAGGHAWVYRKYSRDPAMLDAENRARAAGIGIWALQEDQRIPPWEWRRQQRQ